MATQHTRAGVLEKWDPGTSLGIQWLRIHTSIAGGTGSIPGQGTKTLHASQQGQKVNSVQFSSVAQSCPTLCDPMNRSTPGLPVHHKLPEFTQTHPKINSNKLKRKWGPGKRELALTQPREAAHGRAGDLPTSRSGLSNLQSGQWSWHFLLRRSQRGALGSSNFSSLSSNQCSLWKVHIHEMPPKGWK